MRVVGVPADTNRQIARILQDLQTGIDEANCLPAGFVPFGRAFASTRLTVQVNADSEGTYIFRHDLKGPDGKPQVPNLWIIMDKTGNGEITRNATPWTSSSVAFDIVAATDSSWVIGLFRSDQ
jgi:hypothetical protein